MSILSDRILAMAPSATIAMSQKSMDLKAAGVDVINMAVGEPDFDTPAHIRQAGIKAIQDNITRYSPIGGYTSLKEAISAKLKKENELEYAPSCIVVSGGAKQSLCNVILSTLNPGEEVIIPSPYWVSYPQMTVMAGGIPVFVSASLENNYKITPAQLEAAITPKTKLLILCSPCNPTGAVYTADELKGLADVILRHPGILVISDEIYEHLNYCGSHASIAAVPGMKERTVVINGVSKAYAMTGWRIGFAAGPDEIMKACAKLQGQYTSGTCSISQMAALEAWTASQDCVEQMRKVFQQRRDLIVKLAKEIPGFKVSVPDGAFYLFPDCSYYFGKKGINNATDFCMYLLEDAHVATVAGDAFGAPGCFRISFALSDSDIQEAFGRIKLSLSKL